MIDCETTNIMESTFKISFNSTFHFDIHKYHGLSELYEINLSEFENDYSKEGCIMILYEEALYNYQCKLDNCLRKYLSTNLEIAKEILIDHDLIIRTKDRTITEVIDDAPDLMDVLNDFVIGTSLIILFHEFSEKFIGHISKNINQTTK